MNNYLRKITKKIASSCLLIVVMICLGMGFVAYAAANPVSLYINENNGEYEAVIYLKDNQQMNAFQMKLLYDKKTVQIDSYDFDESFKKIYNAQGNALIRSSMKDDGCISFIGVQTDENCANLKSQSDIAHVRFKIKKSDAGEIAAVLNSFILKIEVIEADNGNIVTDENGWEVHAVYEKTTNNTTNIENKADADDENENNADGGKTKSSDNVPASDLNNSDDSNDVSDLNNSDDSNDVSGLDNDGDDSNNVSGLKNNGNDSNNVSGLDNDDDSNNASDLNNNVAGNKTDTSKDDKLNGNSNNNTDNSDNIAETQNEKYVSESQKANHDDVIKIKTVSVITAIVVFVIIVICINVGGKNPKL